MITSSWGHVYLKIFCCEDIRVFNRRWELVHSSNEDLWLVRVVNLACLKVVLVNTRLLEVVITHPILGLVIFI